ncbi:E3 ubiquitin-protein ligase TRIM69 isoform X2 [Peromyscus eremicus]|uniref:E3 ubiquitin-protein ligase TRIM69 isoform X2 n=1 Tax=Peromyscus eremicus TaxID=42410 RepID=UPI0027DE612C|nr:E3 ubiquitin-protein ligase TRIM69 isoform X2 [Peromyscus eremicus]
MEVSSRPPSNFDPGTYVEVNDPTTHTPSKVVIQDITMELHCPLCNDWFRDPLMLSCGHNFCQACIQNYWKLHAKETFCPECTMLCQYSNCTFNLVLEKLVEKIKKLPLLKGHPQCPEHGENLKLFRGACHLSEPTSDNPEGASVSQNYAERCYCCLQGFQDNKIQLQQHLSLEFLKLHQFLHNKEKDILNDLRDEGKVLNEEMELNLNQIQEQCLLAKDMLINIQTRMEQQNPFNFLKDITKLIDSVAQGMRAFLPRQLISKKLNPGRFKGPIQYMIWREMQSVLCPGLSQLTLDPKTAHPNLVLSDSMTSVCHGDVKQVMPDDPERFDSSVAVLGSKGFTSGKWYWEVEVAKKTKWTVGVVRESIIRKGSCPLTPEQGFWLLRLRNQTDLKALDLPSCSLKEGNLNRVGIYLDYEGGQVSFYNAATMSHLYTFSSLFMETLFPYFCPCLNDGGENKEPLHIVHPQ